VIGDANLIISIDTYQSVALRRRNKKLKNNRNALN